MASIKIFPLHFLCNPLAIYSEQLIKVAIAGGEATCLHAEVPAFAGALRAGRRYGTQARQSHGIASRSLS